MTLLLRLENLAIALMALGAYWQWGGGWTLFLLLVLVPDVSMLAYLLGPRAGAIGYNCLHSFIGVAILLASGYALGLDAIVPIALIWTFHIAFDRALGYGLKHKSGFRDTHLGQIGSDQYRK